MGLTFFGRHKAMLYVGRLMTGLVNGALTPSSQIYVRHLDKENESFNQSITPFYLLTD
jgi:hypothetical protein